LYGHFGNAWHRSRRLLSLQVNLTECGPADRITWEEQRMDLEG
jgi:hypothetical protein